MTATNTMGRFINTTTVLPNPTDPETVEDAFRSIDLVISNQQSDWQGLTQALLTQSETSIIDSISISCYDEIHDDQETHPPSSEQVKACFEAMGTALSTSLGMASLHIKTYHEMPLILLQCVLRTCPRLETLSIGSKVSFDTEVSMQCEEPLNEDTEGTGICGTTTKEQGIGKTRVIEKLQLEFLNEHNFVHMSNLLSDHGISFDTLHIRITLPNIHGTITSSATTVGAHHNTRTQCCLTPSQEKKVQPQHELLHLHHGEINSNSESSKLQSHQVLMIDGQEEHGEANTISPLRIVLNNHQHIVAMKKNGETWPLRRLSIRVASVPSEQLFSHVAKVLSENATTLTSFQLKWDISRRHHSNVGATNKSGLGVVQYRDSVLQAFERMLEKNFFLEDLQVGLWNLTPKTKHFLALNRGKKRRFLAKQYDDITQEEWVDALLNCQESKSNDMSLDFNPYASSTGGRCYYDQHSLSLSSMYYFTRGNPTFLVR